MLITTWSTSARSDYPWIQQRNRVLEALLDNYYEIAHDYDIDDYRSDACDRRLVGSVACEFGADDRVAEAQWVQREADGRGFPHAFIAGVDLMSSSLGAVLVAYRELPIVRAVSQPCTGPRILCGGWAPGPTS
jgi:predicted TIM-barrel fold metal-dependent hydrolase